MLQPASVGFSTHHVTTDTLEIRIDPIDTPCNDSVYLRLSKHDNNRMNLDLFWLIKRNSDNEQPRVRHQIKADDVSFPVISPATNVVPKLLHDAPRKTLDRTFLSWFYIVQILVQAHRSRVKMSNIPRFSWWKPPLASDWPTVLTSGSRLLARNGHLVSHKRSENMRTWHYAIAYLIFKP